MCAQVWSLRVDVHVLDSAGNLVDACCLAALAALLGFRKPQVEVDQAAGEGEAQVIVHPPEVIIYCQHLEGGRDTVQLLQLL